MTVALTQKHEVFKEDDIIRIAEGIKWLTHELNGNSKEKFSASLNQTDEINELVIALSKAQGSMEPAKFNRVNPHFKNRYADFTSCMDACRGPLSKNGLSVMQYCETIKDKLMLVTMLAHTSGQWIKSNFPLIPLKMDSQGIGSAMTYAKRYSLSAMLGIVSDEEEDDDGEASNGRPRQSSQARAPSPQPVNVKRIDIAAIKVISPIQAEEIINLLNQIPMEAQANFSEWVKKRGFEAIAEITPEFYEEVKTKLRLKIASLKQMAAISEKKEEENSDE